MLTTTSQEQPLAPRQAEAQRRKRVRLTTLVVSLVALAFYFGFIVMMLVRGSH